MEIREQGLNQASVNQTGLNQAAIGLDTTATVSSTARVYPSSESLAQNAESSALDPDWATLSDAGSTVSAAVDANDERSDKVAAVRAMLGAGAYRIPVEAVATSAVNAMLGLGA